jgi:hypothetical protein
MVNTCIGRADVGVA